MVRPKELNLFGKYSVGLIKLVFLLDGGVPYEMPSVVELFVMLYLLNRGSATNVARVICGIADKSLHFMRNTSSCGASSKSISESILNVIDLVLNTVCIFARGFGKQWLLSYNSMSLFASCL